MLKTISAALVAVSVLAAPALAAGTNKTTADAPATKTTETKVAPSTTKPAVNAKVTKSHRKHLSAHHRHHSKMAALKTPAKPKLKGDAKLSPKPAAAATTRG